MNYSYLELRDSTIDELISVYGYYYGRLYFQKISELKKDYGANVIFKIPNQKLIDRTIENPQLIEDFLIKYNLEFIDIFDADGMEKSQWLEAIEYTDFVLVTNAGLCRKEYHNLKTRKGHCAICNPKNLGFQRRYKNSAFIYVAYSKSHNLIKVGASEYPANRIDSLNAQGYGNICDWSLEYEAFYENAYCIESYIHDDLSKYKFNITFERLGSIEKSREIFSCSISEAIATIQMY